MCIRDRIFEGELLAGDAGLREFRERMADKLCLHASFAVESLLEGEDHQLSLIHI